MNIPVQPKKGHRTLPSEKTRQRKPGEEAKKDSTAALQRDCICGFTRIEIGIH